MERNYVIIEKKELEVLTRLVQRVLAEITLENGDEPSSLLQEASVTVKNIRKRNDTIKIGNTVTALNSPVRKIIENIISASEDNKLNLGDVKEGIAIIRNISKIIDKYPFIKDELEHLNHIEKLTLTLVLSDTIFSQIT